VPLRSVEAATREDAIAAAREQFGPSARVIGVRRVRSGGVLGFFTTERYVAEVEPGPVRRSIGMPIRDDDARDDRDPRDAAAVPVSVGDSAAADSGVPSGCEILNV